MPFFKPQQRFFVASILLHAVLALAFVFAGSKSNVPFGIARRGAAIIEISVPGIPNLSTPTKVLLATDSVETTKTKNPSGAVEKTQVVAATKSPQQLGFADGTRSMAQIGQADGTANSERDRYLYELRLFIEQKKIYPQISKRLRETGRVIVRFQVMKDGRIEAVDIKSASIFSRLNDAALGLVRGIEKFKPLPQEVLHDQASLEILVPIEYVLN